MSGSEAIKDIVSKLKREYRHGRKNAKLLYNSKMIENSRNKCKTAWKIIKQSSNVCNNRCEYFTF